MYVPAAHKSRLAGPSGQLVAVSGESLPALCLDVRSEEIPGLRLPNREAVRERAAGAADKLAAQARRRHAKFHEPVSRVHVAAHPTDEVRGLGIAGIDAVDRFAADTDRHDHRPPALAVTAVRSRIYNTVWIVGPWIHP